MIDANYTADEIKFLQKLMDRYSEDGGIIDLGLDHAAFMSIVRRHYVSREAAAMTNPTPELQTDEALVEELRAYFRKPEYTLPPYVNDLFDRIEAVLARPCPYLRHRKEY